MLRFLFPLTLALFLVGCNRGGDNIATGLAADSTAATDTSRTASREMLSQGQAGMIRVGMTLADAQSSLGTRLTQAPADPQAPTLPGQTYEVQDGAGMPALRLLTVCNPTCRVQRIEVLSPTYTTGKGIGVGSQLSEVRAAHTVQDLTWRAGEGLSLRLPELNARVILDVTDLDEASLSNPQLDQLPPGLLVERIVLEG